MSKKDLSKIPVETLIENYSEVLDKYKVPTEKRGFIAHMLELQVSEMKEKSQWLSERGTTSDVATVDKVIIPMITRGYKNVIANDLFGVWPMASDTGKFFFMTNNIVGDGQGDSGNTHAEPGDGQILVLSDASSFAVGDAVENSGSTAKGYVIYKEDNTIFIKKTLSAFAVGDAVDDATPYSATAATVSAIWPASVAPYVFREYSKFASIAAGEAASTTIKEVELKISSDTVTAENHKIKSRYTWEELRRLKDYHNMEGDKIINGLGAQYFAQELNRRALYEIKSSATTGGQSTWNYSTADGRYSLEKIKNLLTSINVKSAELLRVNHIGLGNYLVMDLETWAAIDSLGYIDKSGISVNGVADVMNNPYVGVLLGRYKVYVDVWETSNIVNIGMKDFSGGPQAETKAGKFFCPYIPIDIKSTIEDASGQPVKFFWSMYAFKDHPFAATVGSNDFFRRIDVANLPIL